MKTTELDLVQTEAGTVTRGQALEMPIVIAQTGPRAVELALEFFLNRLKTDNTRLAYGRALGRFLQHVHEQHGVEELHEIRPLMVGGYLNRLPVSDPTKKQHLAAIRKFMGWLVAEQLLERNPAQSVEGPAHSVTTGKTPHLEAAEARQLLDSIPLDKLAGYRDRALIALMTYTFARISAALATDVGDYVARNRRRKIVLHEKGGKHHEVWVHDVLEEYLETYLERAGIRNEPSTPLFRALNRDGTASPRRWTRQRAWEMVKRRCRAAGLPSQVCNHSFRATGVTAYLANDGDLKKAARLAAHSSTRTTQLYDRTSDEPDLQEIQRIRI